MNGRGRGAGAWTWRAACAVAVVAAAAADGRGHATEPLSIARLYGSGVHAYFSGDYVRSHEDLTAAIEAGSTDPRARYFRGLAALGLGRLDEAEADFAAGAVLEAKPAGAWPVSRSLERVQGYPRLQLERHRTQGRVAALQRARAMERARYLATAAAQADVQRTRRPKGTVGPDGPTNPFAGETGTGAAPTPEGGLTEPEPMPPPVPPAEVPAGQEPAAAGAELQPELEQPAAEAPDKAAEDGSRMEMPADGGAEPAAEGGPAVEAEAPTEPEADAPFGGEAPPAGAADEPMGVEGEAPAAEGQ